VSKKWLRERSKDVWYKKAKSEGYRSRASFKLLQINEQTRIIRPGDRVVDLGAAPGGWTQIAVELAGPGAPVVGVDLDRIEPLEGATFIRGDMTRPETVVAVLAEIGGEVDVVLSDMSPNISGSYTTDHARSVFLSENALAFATRVLRKGGVFVCKVFEGEMFPDLLALVKAHFRDVRVISPEASRKASSEVYIVGKSFNGKDLRARSEPAEPAWEEGMGLPPSRRARANDGED